MNTDEQKTRPRSGKTVAIMLVSLVAFVGVGAFIVSKNMPMKTRKYEDPAFTQLERLNAELKADVLKLPSSLTETTRASAALDNAKIGTTERGEVCAALSNVEAPRPSGPHSQLLRNIEDAKQASTRQFETVANLRAKLTGSTVQMDEFVKQVKRDARLVRDDPYAEPVAKDEAARQRRDIDGVRRRSGDHVKDLLKTIDDIEAGYRQNVETLTAKIESFCTLQPNANTP